MFVLALLSAPACQLAHAGDEKPLASFNDLLRILNGKKVSFYWIVTAQMDKIEWNFLQRCVYWPFVVGDAVKVWAKAGCTHITVMEL